MSEFRARADHVNHLVEAALLSSRASFSQILTDVVEPEIRNDLGLAREMRKFQYELLSFYASPANLNLMRAHALQFRYETWFARALIQAKPKFFAGFERSLAPIIYAIDAPATIFGSPDAPPGQRLGESIALQTSMNDYMGSAVADPDAVGWGAADRTRPINSANFNSDATIFKFPNLLAPLAPMKPFENGKFLTETEICELWNHSGPRSFAACAERAIGVIIYAKHWNIEPEMVDKLVKYDASIFARIKREYQGKPVSIELADTFKPIVGDPQMIENFHPESKPIHIFAGASPTDWRLVIDDGIGPRRYMPMINGNSTAPDFNCPTYVVEAARELAGLETIDGPSIRAWRDKFAVTDTPTNTKLRELSKQTMIERIGTNTRDGRRAATAIDVMMGTFGRFDEIAVRSVRDRMQAARIDEIVNQLISDFIAAFSRIGPGPNPDTFADRLMESAGLVLRNAVRTYVRYGEGALWRATAIHIENKVEDCVAEFPRSLAELKQEGTELEVARRLAKIEFAKAKTLVECLANSSS